MRALGGEGLSLSVTACGGDSSPKPCHCEERSDVGPKGMPVAQSPASVYQKLPVFPTFHREIATAPLGLRNDRS